jgi:HD-GYP domain-containing protein (c-di-GMP phosphodiesterase class II)
VSLQTVKTQEFIRYLLSASANAALYGMEHQQVTRLCDEAFSRLGEALADTGNDGLLLMVIENELVLNGEPLDCTLFLNRFAEILKARSIGHIRLLSGITRLEVGSMIATLANQGEKDAQPESSDHVRFGQVEVRLGSDGDSLESNRLEQERIRMQLQDMPAVEMDRFREIYESVRRQQKLKITGVAEIVNGFINAFRNQGESMVVLAALRDVDEYTFTHSTNVCILNLAQAMAMGIEGQALNDIGISAILHDIGKLFVPEEILTKPDHLTNREFELMKEHPVRGAKFLLGQPGVPRLAIITAYEHHMRHNLGGYPSVPAGWQLNLCSQMTMISDFFDALRTRRSYREPMGLRNISGMMLDMMGTEFHPALTRNFLIILSRIETAAVPNQP